MTGSENTVTPEPVAHFLTTVLTDMPHHGVSDTRCSQQSTGGESKCCPYCLTNAGQPPAATGGDTSRPTTTMLMTRAPTMGGTK